MEPDAGEQDCLIQIFSCYDSGTVPADRSDWKSDPSPAGKFQSWSCLRKQLAQEDCAYLEKYTRRFNYQETSSIKWEKDTGIYGIRKLILLQCVCSYKKSIYEKLAVCKKAIFNEDMIYAGTMAKAGIWRYLCCRCLS